MIKFVIKVLMLLATVFLFATVNSQEIVDPSTMDHKIMAGYQGWFAASGNGSEYG